jgi:DNA-binding transcriptional ArsR family regulator
VVYPALTFLEEAGYVTSEADGNKKLYTITDEGRAHLSDNREAIESTLAFLAKAGEQMNRFREFAKADWPFNRGEESPDFGNHPPHRGHGWGSHAGPDSDRDLKDVVPELNEARRALKAALKKARRGSEDQQREAADILRHAAAQLEAISDDEVDI